MATLSSTAVRPSLSVNPSTRLTSLSSSNSVSFSYNVSDRAGVGLSVDRSRKAKKRGFSCNCLFGLGVPEIVVIAGVTALVFGPKKLPEVGRSIGKTIKSFQQVWPLLLLEKIINCAILAFLLLLSAATSLIRLSIDWSSYLAQHCSLVWIISLYRF